MNKRINRQPVTHIILKYTICDDPVWHNPSSSTKYIMLSKNQYTDLLNTIENSNLINQPVNILRQPVNILRSLILQSLDKTFNKVLYNLLDPNNPF